MTGRQLERQGWEKRFTATEPRLTEAVELYRATGYEVMIVDATPEDMNEAVCQACLDPSSVKTIYTRKPQTTSGDGA